VAAPVRAGASRLPLARVADKVGRESPHGVTITPLQSRLAASGALGAGVASRAAASLLEGAAASPAASLGRPSTQLPLRQEALWPVQGSIKHDTRLLAHFGSGDDFASGRHEQAPHPSEKTRHSASVLHAVDVDTVGSALAGEAAGAGAEGVGTSPVAGFEGAGGEATTGAALGAGDGSCSLRLQAAKEATTTTQNASDVGSAGKNGADRTGPTREDWTGMGRSIATGVPC
jgi:hypothetical protein